MLDETLFLVQKQPSKNRQLLQNLKAVRPLKGCFKPQVSPPWGKPEGAVESFKAPIAHENANLRTFSRTRFCKYISTHKIHPNPKKQPSNTPKPTPTLPKGGSLNTLKHIRLPPFGRVGVGFGVLEGWGLGLGWLSVIPYLVASAKRSISHAFCWSMVR